jgi:hypothetical protein
MREVEYHGRKEGFGNLEGSGEDVINLSPMCEYEDVKHLTVKCSETKKRS